MKEGNDEDVVVDCDYLEKVLKKFNAKKPKVMTFYWNAENCIRIVQKNDCKLRFSFWIQENSFSHDMETD